MKTITSAILIICSIFISIISLAGGGSGGNVVPPPPGMPPCAVNPPPGATACQATPICNVHGFCGTTDGSYTADYWSQLNNAFCGSIENNAFLEFTAESSSVSFDAYVYNCPSGDGIQVFIFDAANCSSGPVTALVCVNQMWASNTPYDVTANGLIPGNKYYIMIDGYGGDVCDYTFVATDGVALPLGLDIGDNVTICQGETVTPTAYGGDGTYTWDPSPDLSATSGATVTITPPTAVGTYTYVAHSSGGGVPGCPVTNSYTLTVNVITCCQIIENVATSVCDPSTSSYTINGTVTIAGPTGPGGLLIYDCNGVTQTIGTPVAPGSYPYTISGLTMGSDCQILTYFDQTGECSHVLTHVLNYTAPNMEVPTFDFNTPLTFCEGEQVPLLPGTSLNGITGSWSPAAINTAIAGASNYTFTPSPGMCASPFVLQVNVNANPGVNVTTPVTLDCINQSGIQLSTSVTDPGYSYSWTDSQGGSGGIVSGETTPEVTVNSIGNYVILVTDISTGCTSTDTVTVNGTGSEPQVGIDPPIDLDCNTTTTTLVGNATNGVNSTGDQNDLIYEWNTSNGSITSGTNGTTADIDGPGSYTFVVTDQSNGCMTAVSVLVEGNLDVPVITLDAPTTEITCDSPTIPLFGTSDIGSIGTWSTSNGNIVVQGDTLGFNVAGVNVAGTYTYTVINPLSQCSSSMDITVTENTIIPTVSAGPDLVICDSTSVMLQGSGSSNTGSSVTYSWDGTDGTLWLYDFSNIPNPVVPANVTYILTVTDVSNGCSASDTMQVFHHQTPTIFGDTTICGTSFQVPAGSVSVMTTYTWSEQNGNGTFDNNTSLTPLFTADANIVDYVLVLTDECTSVSSNVSLVPQPSASSPSALCSDPKDLITTTTYGGTWSGSGVTFSPNSSVTGGTITTTATATPGSYTVTFTENPVSPCAFSETFTLIFPVDVAIFADTTVCASSFQVPTGSVTSAGAGEWRVSPAGSGTFSPSTTDLHPTFTPNPGVISVNLIYEDVCSSDAATVIFPPQPEVSTPPLYTCNHMYETILTTTYGGGFWTVQDNPATTWHEDTAITFIPGNYVGPGSIQAPVAVSSLPTSGIYTLTFTDAICNYSQTVTLNFIDYPWTQINDTTLCKGIQYELRAADNIHATGYTWNNGSTGQSIIVTEPGVYYVEVYNECYSMIDSAVINYVICDIDAPNIISLSSQSGNNLWFINAHGVSNFNCIIVNRWGNLIYEYNDVNGYWDGRDRSGNIVTEGTYFYQIEAVLSSGEEVRKHGFIQVVH